MAVLAVLALCGCPRGAGGPSGPPAGRRPPVRVTVEKAAKTALSWRLEAVATVEPKEEVPVAGGVAGVAGRVGFNVGDTVTPETVLLTIDEERYVLEERRAQADLDAAKADLDKATADWKRAESLLEQKIISADEHSQAEAAYRRGTAQKARAEAMLALASKALRDCRVRPPIAGTINSRQVSTGQYVKAETVVATIVDLSEIRVRFSVPETDAFHLRTPLALVFESRASASEKPTGEIFWVSQTADPKTRTVECLARLDSIPAGLRPGMSGTVKFQVEQREGCVVAPAEAVLPTERGFVAFVLEGTKARERKLTLGVQTEDGRVEVREGLKEGETVVVLGAAALRDGQEVLVVEAPK